MPIALSTVELQTLATKETQAHNGQIGYWEIYAWLANLLQSTYQVSSTDSTVLWLLREQCRVSVFR